MWKTLDSSAHNTVMLDSQLKTTVDVSSEEAAVLLTRLEYFLLYNLEQKKKEQEGLAEYYEPISDTMMQTLNTLRRKLLSII